MKSQGSAPEAHKTLQSQNRPSAGNRLSVNALTVVHGRQFYIDVPARPFYGFNRPGAKVSQGSINNWWRQGMIGGAKAHYDCIKVFSETDHTEDLKKITAPHDLAACQRRDRRLADRSPSLPILDTIHPGSSSITRKYPLRGLIGANRNSYSAAASFVGPCATSLIADIT
ncbi:MAG TPA: hypothetical protein VII35_02345 [Steroidobacteraceae bacterium]